MADPNWRDVLPTGREQFHYVFQNNLFSDVRFLVGNEQTPVYSHSFVLKVRSAVFERLLEKLHGPVKEINVDGVTTSGFKRFIQFLYIDQLDASPSESLELLPLAKKYRVTSLITQCVAILKNGITENNAASIFQVAREMKEIELEQKAIQFIQNNTTLVFSNKDYLNLNIDNLCHILKMDDLDIKEIKLFEALLEWGKLECTKHTLRISPKHLRMMIKDALALIRFPLMSIEEFNTASKEEILNEKEIKDVLKYLEADIRAREFVKPTLFSTIRRDLIREDEIDLSKSDIETHKRLAKLAVFKSSAGGQQGSPLIVTSLILDVIPHESIELKELEKEILKIKKYGLFWGISKPIDMGNGREKLKLSFAADSRRSYGVGTVVEAVQDLENYVAQVYVHSYEDEIVVRT